MKLIQQIESKAKQVVKTLRMDTSCTGQLHRIIPSGHHITTAMDQP